MIHIRLIKSLKSLTILSAPVKSVPYFQNLQKMIKVLIAPLLKEFYSSLSILEVVPKDFGSLK